VLLDEIEKAHPDIYNLLLQVMDYGKLTDSNGKTIDFRNVVLIMTSNIGADKITHQSTFGFEKRDENLSYEKMRNVLKTELEHYFRPEFLNRVDEVVVFHKLTHTDMVKIVDLEISKVSRRLKEKGLVLEISDEAKDFLLERGTDEKFGARPLRRAIESLLEDQLSENLLRGAYKGKSRLRCIIRDVDGERKIDFEASGDEHTGQNELAVAGAGEST